MRTRIWLLSWLAMPVVAVFSALLAASLPLFQPGWAYALPGMSYALLGLQGPLLTRYQRRLERRLGQ